jgi:hypothetical protein
VFCSLVVALSRARALLMTQIARDGTERRENWWCSLLAQVCSAVQLWT